MENWKIIFEWVSVVFGGITGLTAIVFAIFFPPIFILIILHIYKKINKNKLLNIFLTL